MRKKARRRISTSTLPNKRALQLSQETVRTLASKDLVQAVAGCPTGSSPTTQDPGASTTC